MRRSHRRSVEQWVISVTVGGEVRREGHESGIEPVKSIVDRVTSQG